MPQTMIFKVTESCNMACRYCYVDHKIKGIISAENAKITIAKWVKAEGKDQKLTLIFHGGEPMLAGIKFFEEVIQFVENLKKQGYLIRISMQSNGTLFTDKVLDFLLDHNVEIGLSIDGPELIHDNTRPLVNGQNSHELVVKTIKKIKAVRGRVGIITVMTKLNIDYLINIYEYFKDIGITGISFNELIRGTTNDDLSVSENELNDKLIEFFHYWINDESRIRHIEPFLGIIKRLIGLKESSCVYSESCQLNFIGINGKGFATPCNRISEDSYSYGNILTDSYDAIMAHPLRTLLLDKKKYLSAVCASCQFSKICNGGCLLNIGLEKMMKGECRVFPEICFKKLYLEIYTYLNKVAVDITRRRQ